MATPGSDMRFGRNMTWHRAMEEARKRLGVVTDGSNRISRKSKASALERAAFGPPPPLADPAWLLTPHPYPEVRRVLLPPELTAKLLDKVGTNRPMDPMEIATDARVMLQGMWYFTNEGMALDTEGNLQDGQNRGAAAVLTGTTLDVAIFVGMPIRNFVHLNQGKRRTPVNVAQIRGLANAMNIPGVVRLVMQHKQWRGHTHLRLNQLRITNEELDQEFDSPRLPDYQAGTRIGFRARRAGFTVAGAGAAYCLLREAKVPPAVAQEFIQHILDGTADIDSPSMRLWKYLSRKIQREERVPAVNQFGMIIKCWNATVTGDRYNPEFPAYTGELFPEPYPWEQP